MLDWIQIYEVQEEGYRIRQDLHIGFVKYLLLPHIYQLALMFFVANFYYLTDLTDLTD